ncbi:hypothetical protein HPDFL43_02999 [Hoeflea phototrophica DFL-43]|uniref:DUF6434 domain-containing protein n=2 Tax=Hoeflea TaxID=274591 RepID=A9DDB9_HOEPD|nr:hypothetical protein HPDFL43_02999 [Hoeflea phototrophica DFL-43]
MAGRITPMSMVMTMADKRDWHSDPITSDTLIDGGYKTTQNVRRFFKAQIGDHFKFDRAFMAWMKSRQGATMGDAVREWCAREAGK